MEGKGRENDKTKPKLTLLLKTRHPLFQQHHATGSYPIPFPFFPVLIKTIFNPILYFPFEVTVEGLQLKLSWL